MMVPSVFALGLQIGLTVLQNKYEDQLDAFATAQHYSQQLIKDTRVRKIEKVNEFQFDKRKAKNAAIQFGKEEISADGCDLEHPLFSSLVAKDCEGHLQKMVLVCFKVLQSERLRYAVFVLTWKRSFDVYRYLGYTEESFQEILSEFQNPNSGLMECGED